MARTKRTHATLVKAPAFSSAERLKKHFLQVEDNTGGTHIYSPLKTAPEAAPEETSSDSGKEKKKKKVRADAKPIKEKPRKMRAKAKDIEEKPQPRKRRAKAEDIEEKPCKRRANAKDAKGPKDKRERKSTPYKKGDRVDKWKKQKQAVSGKHWKVTWETGVMQRENGQYRCVLTDPRTIHVFSSMKPIDISPWKPA